MSSPPSPPIAERIKHLNGNHLKIQFNHHHLSNIYSQHSDDDEEYQYNNSYENNNTNHNQMNLNAINSNNSNISSISSSNSKSKKKRSKKKKNTLTRKYKKYSPPKHIQQKINIHKAIRRLSSSSMETDSLISNQTKSTSKRSIRNNNKKRKLSTSQSNNMTMMKSNSSKPSLINQIETNSTDSSLISLSHSHSFKYDDNMQSPLEYINDNSVDYSQCNETTCFAPSLSMGSPQGIAYISYILCAIPVCIMGCGRQS